MTERSARKRVLILGGGFAGVSTAQELVKRLKRARRTDVDVVLLNRDNYFVFQPLLADILSATIETTHVVVPLRRMLPGVDVEVGFVESVDTEARRGWLRRRLTGER